MSALLDADEVARRLCVSRATAYREMRKMLHVVVGKRALRVNEAAFEAYVKRRTSSPVGARARIERSRPISEPIRPIFPRTKSEPEPSANVTAPDGR